MKNIEPLLRFYYITDDGATACPPIEQVRAALANGATLVQYRNKGFNSRFYEEAAAIRELCRQRNVPLVINDNILLAKAVAADGVHLGQDDDSPELARKILGPDAIVGLSVSTLEELAASELEDCDYIGSGPVFGTRTKADAKPRRGLEGLREMVKQSPLPVVAIGGITVANAVQCLQQGAAGVAVISAVSRAEDPSAAAHNLAVALKTAHKEATMFCPRCRTEYREGFTTCADCNVDLVDELAPETDEGYVEYEEVLSTYNPGDIAVIKSMLESEDITYYFKGEHLTLRPMGDAARLMVKKEEAQSVRELLSDLELSYSEASSFKEEDEDESEDDTPENDKNDDV